MSMSEELKARKPDVHTLEWWNSQFQEVLKGYRGATHSMNKLSAENEDLSRQNADLRAKLQAWSQANAEERKVDRAKIGELQARVEKMAEFLNKVKPTLTHPAKKD